MTKSTRRQFLKSIGLAGAGVAATTIPIPNEPIRNLSELANFNNGRLSRDYSGWWRLYFTSSEKLDPSGEKSLIVELGDLKFQLAEIENIKVEWLDDEYYYRLGGNKWESLRND